MNILTNDLLMGFVSRGIITVEEVVGSSEETIMKTILDKIHTYKITEPKKEAKDQRWSTYVKDETVPSGRRKVVGKTKRDLFLKLLKHYGISEKDTKGMMTFGELFEEWSSYREGFIGVSNTKKSLKMTTVTKARKQYKRCFGGTTLDATPLYLIRSIDIQNAFKDAISKYSLKERYVNGLLGYFKNCYEYAIRCRYIDTNEFMFVDRDLVLSIAIPDKPKNDEERTLTGKQMKDLYEAVRCHLKRHPDYMPDYAVLLCMLTGMRVGELAALHWSDIRNGFIFIDYSEHRDDYQDHSELTIGEPKNLKHRKFPLNEMIDALLNEIKGLGIDSEFVFANNEKRFTAHDISCACDRRAKEAGIENVCPHRIRRTVASELRKKFDVKLVANLLGHLEKTDEDYYNYDNSEISEKIKASRLLYSNVLNFRPKNENKKTAKAL